MRIVGKVSIDHFPRGGVDGNILRKSARTPGYVRKNTRYYIANRTPLDPICDFREDRLFARSLHALYSGIWYKSDVATEN